MTQEEQTLLTIKGMISSLPEEDVAAVKRAYDDIILMLHRNGDAGRMAMALVGAELAATEDE